MPRRFQFSLRRLLGATAILSLAGALTDATRRSIPSDAAPIMAAMAFGFAGAGIGMLLSKQWVQGAAFGAMFGLIAFGLFMAFGIAAKE